MLTITNVSFAYDELPVLRDISFTVQKGQHIALIGASGCGKSTLLKIIYGLLHPQQGTLSFNGNPLLGPLFNLVPGEENMKYLSQGFELQAFRTVAENTGAYLSNVDQELKQGRIKELLDIVEMSDFANVKVEQLSGGQKQRVALAKALAKKPELLLLDEPFGNIDNFRRSSLRRNLFRYLKRNKITSITATHDKTDILSFTDQTIVIKQGAILTQENTLALYKNPTNFYVASLFGEVNKIPVHLFYPTYTDKTYILAYPHEIQIQENSSVRAKVKRSYFQGNHFLIESVLGREIIFVENTHYFPENEEIGIEISQKLVVSRLQDNSQ